ncbi:MAG: class I SAM-dependent methyltransferase [Methylophagaceae bacterium]
MQSIQEKWDEIYRQVGSRIPTPSLVLQQNSHLLPERGTALDLACGRGGNALFLAKAGLNVQAWDLSAIAIAELQNNADINNLAVKTEVRDVTSRPPLANSVDVLVVSFFLERPLCSELLAAIKPGGLLFYQTYCQQKVDRHGPSNPAYLLKENELLQLFSSMKVRVYREEALAGNRTKGLRNQAILVAEK